MPPLPMQLRLDERHVAALDNARVVTDPASGLTVELSRQQVLLGILDQWIAAQARQTQPRSVTDTVTDTGVPQSPARRRKRQAASAD